MKLFICVICFIGTLVFVVLGIWYINSLPDEDTEGSFTTPITTDSGGETTEQKSSVGETAACEWIKNMTDGHNYRRLKVALGEVNGQPAAGKMKYMTWDDKLAEIALEWAKNGIYDHNPKRQYVSDTGMVEKTSDNVFESMTSDKEFIPSTDQILDAWFEEHNHYTYKSHVAGTSNDPEIGHYTQMIWADSSRVGCGSSYKDQNNKRITLVVCNYTPPGNYIGRYPYPLKTAQEYVDKATWGKNVEGPVYGKDPNCK